MGDRGTTDSQRTAGWPGDTGETWRWWRHTKVGHMKDPWAGTPPWSHRLCSLCSLRLGSRHEIQNVCPKAESVLFTAVARLPHKSAPLSGGDQSPSSWLNPPSGPRGHVRFDEEEIKEALWHLGPRSRVLVHSGTPLPSAVPMWGFSLGAITSTLPPGQP